MVHSLQRLRFTAAGAVGYNRSWCYNMVLSKDTGFSQLQLVLLPQAAASVTQNQLCTCSLCDDEPPDAYTRNITISPETCRP